MSSNNHTPQAPRRPTREELEQLAAWLCASGLDDETAAGFVRDACIAVFDTYQTDGPGYCGKLMSVVWSGSPSIFDVFLWNDGRIERSGRDYDPKECDRCGATNASLCFDCWRHAS